MLELVVVLCMPLGFAEPPPAEVAVALTLALVGGSGSSLASTSLMLYPRDPLSNGGKGLGFKGWWCREALGGVAVGVQLGVQLGV